MNEELKYIFFLFISKEFDQFNEEVHDTKWAVSHKMKVKMS